MPRNEVPWLRLVYDSRDIPLFRAHDEYPAEQLELPLERPDIAVVIDVEDFQFATFRSALLSIQPKWIFDVRVAPRFDKLTGGRSHAFRYFEDIGSQYLDVFGILNIRDYRRAVYNPKFWTPVLEDLLGRFDSKDGPFLALLDDDELINSMSRFLASSISHVTGRPIALSRYRYEESSVG